MRKIVPILLLITTLGACQTRQLHSESHAIGLDGWHQDSMLNYAFSVEDTLASYDILLNLRYNPAYDYQNLWMFVDEWYGDSLVQRDTIECYLADKYGRWLGSGVNTYQLPLVYYTDFHFERAGNYRFVLQQGMRIEYLHGITDVGLQVVKHDGKE